jgi:type III pantothenate kinase
MLLVIDVGNTHTVFGTFVGDRLAYQWRLATHVDRTADEMNLKIGGFLAIEDHWLKEVDSIAVTSVVPEMTEALDRMVREIMGLEPLIVDSDTDTGVPVLCDDPSQVGADRIVDAAAAIEKYGAPCIVIDFGTANTIDAVNANGEYLGGTITLGLQTTSGALSSAAATLIKVDSEVPERSPGVEDIKELMNPT